VKHSHIKYKKIRFVVFRMQTFYVLISFVRLGA